MDNRCGESSRIQHVNVFVDNSYSTARDIRIRAEVKYSSVSIQRGRRRSETRQCAAALLSVATDLAHQVFCLRTKVTHLVTSS